MLERLHRLRSNLARLKSEIEIARIDGIPPGHDVAEAVSAVFRSLQSVERLLVSPDSDSPRPASDDTRRRVFVVDDDLRLADLTCRQLRRYGFECVARADLFDALIEVEPDDALVVDLGLIKESDSETRSRLRSLQPIVVSGAVARDEQLIANEVGARTFLVKPLEVPLLAQALRKPAEQP